MRRRDLLLALAAGVSGRLQQAAAQSRVPHVVYFWFGAAGSETSTSSGLQAGLRELGYKEGRDFTIDYRYADGKEEKLRELVAEALAENPDLILAPGTIVTRIVKERTNRIPVVSTTFDPVGAGFVKSLAHPGGNITGLAIAAGPELAEKWLELIAEIAPGATLIAMLANAANPATRAQLERMEIVAPRIGNGFRIAVCPYHDDGDFPAAIATAERTHPAALIADIDPLTVSKRDSIVAFAAEHRIPAVYGLRDFVDAGGLISYGASIFDIWRRAAVYIDRILKGVKPADLPIEQPTKFELVVNLKTFKSLGLTVHPTILARADEVIE